VESKCFSVIGSEDMMNVEAPTPSVVSTWLSGVRHILEHAGLLLLLKEEKQTYTQGFKMMRFTVQAGSARLPTPAVAVTARLTEGVEVTVYSALGSVVTAAKQHLIFDGTAGKLGGLYWCAPNTRARRSETYIALHRLDDITIAKHSDVLRSVVAQSAPEACCLSLTARGDTLHCQFQSPKALQSWLADINHILTTGGIKLQLVQGMPVTDARTGYTSGRQRFLSHASDRGDASGEFRSAYVSMLVQGRQVKLYSTKDEAPTESRVFYSPDNTKFGSLYWAAPDSTAPVEAQRLALESITCIVVNSNEGAFSGNVKRELQLCLSLLAADRSLHMEFGSRQQCLAWLEAVTVLLSTCGRKVMTV
jgi:hypothetical protein